MNWSSYVLIAIVVLLIVGGIVKIYLARRLKSINGLGAIQKGEKDENVIAAIGDDSNN